MDHPLCFQGREVMVLFFEPFQRRLLFTMGGGKFMKRYRMNQILRTIMLSYAKIFLLPLLFGIIFYFLRLRLSAPRLTTPICS